MPHRYSQPRVVCLEAAGTPRTELLHKTPEQAAEDIGATALATMVENKQIGRLQLPQEAIESVLLEAETELAA